MGRKSKWEAAMAVAESAVPTHSLAAWSERQDRQLDQQIAKDRAALDAVHKFAKDAPDGMGDFEIGVAAEFLRFSIEADITRAHDAERFPRGADTSSAAKGGVDESPIARAMRARAKKAARDPLCRWRNEIDALRSWRPGADHVHARDKSAFGGQCERLKIGASIQFGTVNPMPAPDPHFVALRRALEALSASDLRLLVCAHVALDLVVGAGSMGAIAHAKAVREGRLPIPADADADRPEGVHWERLVVRALGLAKSTFAERLRESDLTMDEQEAAVAAFHESESGAGDLAEKAHLEHLDRRVASQSRAARRALRDALAIVELDVTPSRMIPQPTYREIQHEKAKTSQNVDVCMGSRTEHGVKLPCETGEELACDAEALPLCRNCGRPRSGAKLS